MNINISLWNMLAVGLFRGSKRLNNFLKSSLTDWVWERVCIMGAFLVCLLSCRHAEQRDREKWTQWDNHSVMHTKMGAKERHTLTNKPCHRHKKREKGRYIRGKCRMRYACRLKQTQRQPLWSYSEMQTGGSRRKRQKKYKHNGTQSVKDLLKQQ